MASTLILVALRWEFEKSHQTDEVSGERMTKVVEDVTKIADVHSELSGRVTGHLGHLQDVGEVAGAGGPGRDMVKTNFDDDGDDDDLPGDASKEEVCGRFSLRLAGRPGEDRLSERPGQLRVV